MHKDIGKGSGSLEATYDDGGNVCNTTLDKIGSMIDTCREDKLEESITLKNLEYIYEANVTVKKMKSMRSKAKEIEENVCCKKVEYPKAMGLLCM